MSRGRDYDILERRHRRPSREPSTGTVVQSSARGGVMVALIDGDTRHPIGPCMGATRVVYELETTTTTVSEKQVIASATLERSVELLPVGTTVLVVETPQGPWIAAWEETGEP